MHKKNTSEHRRGTRQISSGELPLWTGAQLPENGRLILLTEEVNYDVGGRFSAAYQLELSRVAPGGNFETNTYSIYAPTSGITVPPKRVVPAYREGFSPHNLMRAQANSVASKAAFLILSPDQNIDTNYVIQSSGYYTFPEGHDYVTGHWYYLSDSAAGEVTTTAPAVAQPLFYVVDNRTIQIEIGH